MNPYAPPRAALADADEARRGRPALVWVITLLVGFGVLFESAGTILLFAGQPIGGEEAARAAQFMGPLEHVGMLVVDALSALAAVALFRLKRSALPLFVADFAATVAFALLEALFRPEYRALFEGAAVLPVAAGWLINGAIVAYVWRLRVRGVLHA